MFFIFRRGLGKIIYWIITNKYSNRVNNLFKLDFLLKQCLKLNTWLNIGVDVNTLSPLEWSGELFITAACYGRKNIIRILSEELGREAINEPFRCRNTWSIEKIQQYISCEGYTTVHTITNTLCAYERLLAYLVPTSQILQIQKLCEQNVGALLMLLEYGADINAIISCVSPSIITKFNLEDIFKHCPSKAMFRDTALHLAIQFNSLAVINILLEQDADVNAINSIGMEPLLAAILTNNLGIVNTLLEHGASPFFKKDCESLIQLSILEFKQILEQKFPLDTPEIKQFVEQKLQEFHLELKQALEQNFQSITPKIKQVLVSAQIKHRKRLCERYEYLCGTFLSKSENPYTKKLMNYDCFYDVLLNISDNQSLSKIAKALKL